jgi:hypothetical protein
MGLYYKVTTRSNGDYLVPSCRATIQLTMLGDTLVHVDGFPPLLVDGKIVIFTEDELASNGVEISLGD